MTPDEFDKHIAEIRAHGIQYAEFGENDPRTEGFYYGTFSTISREVHALKPALDPIIWGEVHDHWLCYADVPPTEFEPQPPGDKRVPMAHTLRDALQDIIHVAAGTEDCTA